MAVALCAVTATAVQFEATPTLNRGEEKQTVLREICFKADRFSETLSAHEHMMNPLCNDGARMLI